MAANNPFRVPEDEEVFALRDEEAARKRATVGEMSDALAAELGRHKAEIQGVRGVWTQHMSASAEIDILQDRIAEFTEATGCAPRILMAKLGQDGHDRGQKVIASAFADLGFEVITGPLFQTPEEAYDLAIALRLMRLVLPRRGASQSGAGARRKLDAGADDILSY